MAEHASDEKRHEKELKDKSGEGAARTAREPAKKLFARVERVELRFEDQDPRKVGSFGTNRCPGGDSSACAHHRKA
jgi:hypothetical protein